MSDESPEIREKSVHPYGGPQVVVLPDEAGFAAAAAERVARTLNEAVRRSGVATLALAGGSTPRPVYRRLVAGAWRRVVRWPEVEVFWSDERCVPPDHEESNYRMAQEELLSEIPVSDGRVHRVRGELPPGEALEAYRNELATTLGPLPVFDLVLLGMGEDGHTASLFPDQFSGAADPHPGIVVAATEAPVEPRQRVTFTLSCLNAARHVLFLVRGEEKAEMAARVLGAARLGAVRDAPPAARVRPLSGELVWMLDEAAASKLAEGAR